MKKIKFNSNKGITLIALIITVIILLILAGTAISISINGGDLFGKSQNAVAEYNNKVDEENTEINRWLSYLDQYSGEGGEDEPATGTLEVDYKLLADVENTYKKVTLEITGLDNATELQLLQAIADCWNDGSSADDVKSYIEEDVEDEYYSNYNEGLLDYAQGAGVSLLEPVTVTAKFNGGNIPTYNNSFLATQNGTYEVTVRSASNKVGTVNVLIDGNNIGKTKEQSGINEEIFASPSSVDYTDTNGDYARIPNGYYVGTSNTIKTIAEGLVITSSIDGNGHSTGDEYVWIPVADINNMIMCKSNSS